MTKSATERAEAQQWAEYVQYLENEVEKLRVEIGDLWELRTKDGVEIERLNDLLKCSSEKECMHLRAEIEQLRARSFCPNCECGVCEQARKP